MSLYIKNYAVNEIKDERYIFIRKWTTILKI